MALYTCRQCGGPDWTGWTYYWLTGAPYCALCLPVQRCHWHWMAYRIIEDEEGLGEVDCT